MLDSIYHKTMMITSKLLRNSIFGVKKSRFCHFYATLFKNGHNYVTLDNLKTTSGLSILLHGIISF